MLFVIVVVLLLMPKVMTLFVHVLLQPHSAPNITTAERLVPRIPFVPQMVALLGHVLMLGLKVRGIGVLVVAIRVG